MIDLDRFKEINDSFGHSVGDDLLCLVGPRLQQALAAGRPAGPDGRRRVRRPAARRRRRPRPGGRRPASAPPCATRSCSTACPCTSTPASASRSAPTTAATVRCCSPAPTPPCTWPSAAGTGSRSGRPTAPRPPATGWRPWSSCARPWTPTSSTSTTSPSSTCGPARVIGVEALVRWNHPDRGLLYPDVFLPLAEQAGLMRRLALGVLERSLRDLAAWRAAGHDLSVAVNLSVSNLQDVALPEQVEMLLDAFAVPAEALDPGDHRGRPHGRRRPQPAGHGRAAAARRPAVDRRLRHRLLVAVLPARAARRRAQARPQLRQPPDVGRAGRGDRPQHAAAEPGPGHEHGRRGRRGRRDARRRCGPGAATSRRATTSPGRCRPTKFLGWLAEQPAPRAVPPRSPLRRRPERHGEDRHAAPLVSRRRPRTAGRPHLAGARGGAASATGCCAPAAASPAGPTPSSSSATRRSRSPTAVAEPSTRWYAAPRPAAARPGARCPAPRRADAAFAAAGLDPRRGQPGPHRAARPAGRRPTSPVDLAPAPGRRLARRLPLPRHPAAAGGAPTSWSTPTSRSSPSSAATRRRRRWPPSPAASLVDGWLCVTAVTVDERLPAARPGDGGDGRRSAPGRASGAGTRACCRWPSATRRRWRSTSGWASPSTTATTTGWAPSRRRRPADRRPRAAERPADGERRGEHAEQQERQVDHAGRPAAGDEQVALGTADHRRRPRRPARPARQRRRPAASPTAAAPAGAAAGCRRRRRRPRRGTSTPPTRSGSQKTSTRASQRGQRRRRRHRPAGRSAGAPAPHPAEAGEQVVLPAVRRRRRPGPARPRTSR